MAEDTCAPHVIVGSNVPAGSCSRDSTTLRGHYFCLACGKTSGPGVCHCRDCYGAVTNDPYGQRWFNQHAQ